MNQNEQRTMDLQLTEEESFAILHAIAIVAQVIPEFNGCENRKSVKYLDLISKLNNKILEIFY